MDESELKREYKAFCKWCHENPSRGLDPRLRTHSGRLGYGGYICQPKAASAWAAWQARAREKDDTLLDALRILLNPDSLPYAEFCRQEQKIREMYDIEDYK